MRIPWELILAFAAGLLLMGFAGYLLLVPMRFLWRLVAGAVLGALVLMVINAVGSLINFSVAVNPFTALAVGFLGLPGAILLIVLQFIL